MQKLIVLQGIPGSGKSTYGKELALANPLTHARVCRDDIRNQFGKYWVPERENLVSKIERFMIEEALCAGFNVIIDATNLNPKTLAIWEHLVAHHNDQVKRSLLKGVGKEVTIEYKKFDTSLEECLRRDALRGVDSRGEKVIKDFYYKYCVDPLPVPTVERIVQDSTLPKIIIVDIDGTVALANGRGHFDYMKVDTDLPNKQVIMLVENYLLVGGEVVFLSGREDICKALTEDWLYQHIALPDAPIKLFMRKAGDHRKDCIIKKEIFDAEIKGKYFVEFCLDDRNQMIRLWRDMGLSAFQVADGDF